MISTDLIESFFKSLEDKKYHKEEFYDIALNFLESKLSFKDEKEVDAIEQKLYSLAFERGFIGYNIIFSVSPDDTFLKKFNDYIIKKGYYIFQFIIERDEEKTLSFSGLYNLWNNCPPLGWFGGWCSCGEFFPYTLDLGSMDLETNQINQDFPVKPIKFTFDDIKQIDFCSDNYIRFYLHDETVVAAKPFKVDVGIAFNFIDNPLELLK